jgi:hypothetical protein
MGRYAGRQAGAFLGDFERGGRALVVFAFGLLELFRYILGLC